MAWKLANVCPLPKASSICNINEDLRPISLTPTLSKVAKSFIIDIALKPVLLPIIDPCQFGFIPGSSTTLALISMFHHWLRATDGTQWRRQDLFWGGGQIVRVPKARAY